MNHELEIRHAHTIKAAAQLSAAVEGRLTPASAQQWAASASQLAQKLSELAREAAA